MTASELRATLALASIMVMRMLGLFMVLPVFAIYASQLEGVTPTLAGIAIGVYGLTQTFLQIPFGMLSDRFGRKPIISLGLGIFALGSVIAALSHGIVGIIIGRALQGTGAISSALLALTADLTQEEHRTKAMAIMGISIGMSFVVALVLGPVLSRWIGVLGLFWVSAVLAIIAIVVLYKVVPQPLQSRFHSDAEPVPAKFKRVLQDPELLRLDAGIFLLHLLLTALFVTLPMSLKDVLPPEQHWLVYLSTLVAAVIAMMPFMMIAERYRRLKQVFIGAIAVLALSQLGLGFVQHSLWGMVIMLFLFFTAFTLLEATLPSLISKIAPADSKGTAMGVYASTQFFGAFLGGVLGGWLQQHYSHSAVFLIGSGLATIWLGLAITMKNPRYLSSQLLNVGVLEAHQAQLLVKKLLEIRGVVEAAIAAEEGVAYLKIDKAAVNMAELTHYSVAMEQR
ncbi:MAG: MFS transporter [Thiotrichaceae bacterium]|nr:MFS transporter [Thiotrichaceae bacterium]